jgi:hypothetical protein
MRHLAALGLRLGFLPALHARRTRRTLSARLDLPARRCSTRAYNLHLAPALRFLAADPVTPRSEPSILFRKRTLL